MHQQEVALMKVALCDGYDPQPPPHGSESEPKEESNSNKKPSSLKADTTPSLGKRIELNCSYDVKLQKNY